MYLHVVACLRLPSPSSHVVAHLRMSSHVFVWRRCPSSHVVVGRCMSLLVVACLRLPSLSSQVVVLVIRWRSSTLVETRNIITLSYETLRRYFCTPWKSLTPNKVNLCLLCYNYIFVLIKQNFLHFCIDLITQYKNAVLLWRPKGMWHTVQSR